MIAYIKKSMANRIVLMIALIFMLTIVAIGSFTFRLTYEELINNKLIETKLRAESISKDVVSIFDDARIVTQQLAIHPEIKAYLKTAVDRKSIVNNPYYKETLNTLVETRASGGSYFLAWVANEKANFYLDSLGIIPDDTYDVKKRPWYPIAVEAKDYAFTPPYVEWGTRRVVISCIKPMRENGSIYGFVVMDFVLENIPEIFKNASIHPTDKNFLITAEGDYIFHSDSEKIMKANINDPQDALNPYVELIEKPSQNLSTIEYEGKNYYLQVYKVDKNGWKVISLIDENALLAELQKKEFTLMGLLAVIFVITLIIVYTAVQKTMRPYKEVLHFAQDIADGEFSKNIPQNYLEREDEMGTLSRSFQIIIDAFRSENMILEEKITEKNLELEQQYAFIFEAEKAASLGHLVAGVAHEINTPVGIGLSTASYLKRINDEQRKKLAEGTMNREDLKELMSVLDESVRLLNTNLERAADLVKSFKQLAVDQSSGSIGKFDLRDNIDSVVLSMLHEYKNLPIRFDIKCPLGISLYSYPGALSQIFTNLINNSLHHGLKGLDHGTIGIIAVADAKQVKIIYTDDGRGISPENMKKIYEPFFTTNRQSGNSGLGMHIVMNLVTQKLKGTIRCESEEGKGVKFTIEFPIELESV